MKIITSEAIYLGIKQKEYDFTDKKGEQKKGTSSKAIFFDCQSKKCFEASFLTDLHSSLTDLEVPTRCELELDLVEFQGRISYRLSKIDLK